MPTDVALACRDEELGRVNLARLVQVPLYPIQAAAYSSRWSAGIVVVDSIPLTANGKVDRAALASPLNQRKGRR
jgi:acyl-CoA synthetase (AMP-forming)/AMP-acid ligase II